MSYVVIYTIGRLMHPYEHPISQDFYKITQQVYEQAQQTGALIKAFDNEGAKFPLATFKGEGYPVYTLTIWKDMESLYRFTYSGTHRDALKRRKEWLVPNVQKQPIYVIWWTNQADDVTWEEALIRYNHLEKNGPSPFAFNLKSAFDADGKSLLINRSEE